MAEKTPRLKPHTMTSLAHAGIDMYRPPLNPDQQRRIGQMSLTDGVFIPRETPTPYDDPRDLAENQEF